MAGGFGDNGLSDYLRTISVVKQLFQLQDVNERTPAFYPILPPLAMRLEPANSERVLERPHYDISASAFAMGMAMVRCFGGRSQ